MGKRCNVLFSSGEESMNGIELRHDDNITRIMQPYKSRFWLGANQRKREREIEFAFVCLSICLSTFNICQRELRL